jgi:hypothetical protein
MEELIEIKEFLMIFIVLTFKIKFLKKYNKKKDKIIQVNILYR